MASLRVQLQVGVTFVIAIILLLAGIFWLKEYRPTVRTEVLRAVFDDAGGITRGDPVMVAGVKAGEVQSVSLTPDNRALIAFSVQGGVDLRSDAAFRIIDVGVMGDKALIITPGTASAALRTDIVHKGGSGVGLDALMADAERLLKSLNSIAAEADSGIDIPRLAGSFETAMDRVGSAADEYGDLALRNRRNIDSLLRNLDSLSANLNHIVDANGDEASDTVRNMNRAAQALTRLAGELEPLGMVADTLSVYVGDGRGTLGKMVKSDDLYNEIRETRGLLDSLIVDIKRDPGRYTKGIKLNFSLF